MTKLRLIQCGVGGFGRNWLLNYTSQSQDFDLVAIVDVSEEALEQGGEEAGIPPQRRFRSLEEALQSIEADAVLSVTPPAVHIEHARLAFQHGLHLMTEKPIADTLEHALEMVALARQAGRQLVVSQNYRYRAPVQTMRALLNQCAIGEFGHGHLDFYIPADFTGTFRETMEFPLLIDMAIHHLDLIRYVTGRDIARVTALSFRPAWSWYRHDPGLKMLLELSDGTAFSYSGDWSARGQATSWNGDWRLQCAEGSIHLTGERVWVARSERWNRNPTREEIPLMAMPSHDQGATLHQFAVAIRTGQPAEVSGEDNLRSFAAVIAGVKSAREGRPVALSELLPD